MVARFLALLELYREGVVAFDQAAALAELRVRWTGPGAGEAADDSDDEYDEAADDAIDAAVDEEYG